MKILLALMFLAATAFGQATCPEGTKRAGGIGTTGCMWEAGCYTPEEIKKYSNFIGQCICEETSMAMWTSDTFYTNGQKWVNDQCVGAERWEKRVGDKWVRVTKEEYDKVLAVEAKRKPVSKKKRRKR